MTHISFLIYILMTILGALGSISFSAIYRKTLFSQKMFYLVLGGSFYFFSAISNIYLLKFLPISTLMPAAALNYIWVYLFARIVYKEAIKSKLPGLLSILVGLIFLYF